MIRASTTNAVSGDAISNKNQSAKDRKSTERVVHVRVLRQDGLGQASYWERHEIPYEINMNVISILQRIAQKSCTQDGRPVPPVAWDCNCLEEVCGSCTMVVNGRTRMACTSLVDALLVEDAQEIELRPMSKFPVVRDLVVDRKRVFHALERVQAWIPIDGSFDQGSGPRISPDEQQDAYPLSTCMSCGCCLEACPQYTKIEIVKRPEETVEEFGIRRKAAFHREFMGAHAISQAMLFNNHPTGRMNAEERLSSLTSQGGIQMCGNAQNCVAVCPKSIPLTRSIARAGRAATVWAIKKLFDR